MTNSDIIAIIALVVSGITSLATVVSSVLNNRANIIAKRDEMAFTEQIKAFTLLVEQATNDVEKKEGRETIIQQVHAIEDKNSTLQKTTIQSSILLPPGILTAI